MKPPGLAQVEAAKADGRWATAYSMAKTQAPPDLLTAIRAEPKALAMYEALSSQNRLGAAPLRRRQVVGISRLEGINAGRELLLRSRRAAGARGTRSPDHERSENQSDRVC